MGQKVNPKIFRLGIKKTQWDSRYFERKKEETTLYNYQNIEILTYLKQFLLLNGLMLQKTKFHFNDTNLYIHISYFSTKKSFFLINKKTPNQNIKLKNSMPQRLTRRLLRELLVENTPAKPKIMRVYRRKTTFQQWPTLILEGIRKSTTPSFLRKKTPSLIELVKNSKKILESKYFLDLPYSNSQKKIKKKFTFSLFKKLVLKKKLTLFKEVALKKRLFLLKKFRVKNFSFSAYKKYVKTPSSSLFQKLVKKQTSFSYHKFVGKKAPLKKKSVAKSRFFSFKKKPRHKKIPWFKKKLKEENQFKIQRLGILSSYKTFLQHKNYKSNDILRKNLFLEQFLEGLSLYTNKKYNIFFTFQNLNRGMSVLLSQMEQDFIKKRLLSLKRYSKEKFFKESLNIMLIVIKIKNSARLIAELIAQQFKFLKRHNYFVTFIRRIVTLFISFKFSKVKGIKIRISGRFNRASRAKSRLIVVGDMPIQTISKQIDYHETTSYTKNGTFGIKLWMNYD